MPLASMSKVTSTSNLPWGRRDADEIELAEHLIVGGHLALALEHADGDGVLIVFRRRRLALLGRDGGVAVEISRVNTPPKVSMPSDSGVTSSSSTSLTSPWSAPA